jgi:glycosyltransferase involved in cell wall biosynthesis
MKKNNPIFSIVIPTYNCASFLKRSLKSVINQTFKNWEAIVIDNFSTDNTKQIVTSFKDERIKYLKIKNNGIIAKSRNLGIRSSKGEWIAFLDSDDYWSPDKLKKCTNFVNSDVDLLYHDLQIVSNNERQFFKRNTIKTRQLRKPVLNDLLVCGNIIGNSSVVVRKKLLVSNNYLDERKDLVTVEDYHMWLKIAKFTNNFHYIPLCLGYYLDHEQNLSNRNMSIPSRNAVKEFKQFLNLKENLKLETNIKYMNAMFNYKNKDFKKATKDLLFILINGDKNLKIKSLVIILIIIFKRLF